MSRYVCNERGGAHVLLFGLMAVMFAVSLLVVSLNWMLQSTNKTKTKLVLDRAVHAAALNIDPTEAALGRLVWDQASGTADFYTYLSMNLKLDPFGEPGPGSYIARSPVVHLLEFVSLPSYPSVVRRSVTVRIGTPEETVRNIDVTVYGPSLVAIVEVEQRMIGASGRTEPIVLSSVANVRFR
ncbi:hypothetical protein [Paenibacillus thermotolerans]|uniref:hypothetical protein n=1 Tax=Paenibacillus thermotolerans TaxID=3027807 RepID=UPI0023683246|nr:MULTISPECIES: hypothetical protein [unclassified Paenibacillus]